MESAGLFPQPGVFFLTAHREGGIVRSSIWVIIRYSSLVVVSAQEALCRDPAALFSTKRDRPTFDAPYCITPFINKWPLPAWSSMRSHGGNFSAPCSLFFVAEMIEVLVSYKGPWRSATAATKTFASSGHNYRVQNLAKEAPTLCRIPRLSAMAQGLCDEVIGEHGREVST
jgi:hypothetical protein